MSWGMRSTALAAVLVASQAQAAIDTAITRVERIARVDTFTARFEAASSPGPTDTFATRFEALSPVRVAELHPSYSSALSALEPRPKEEDVIPAGRVIVGAASMYDPTDASDRDSGTEELSSGERYDPRAWTAAIRTDLRERFGGVKFGRNYRPSYALVETDDKRLIVRINDVGPLRSGRVIDLNRRSMAHFDPTLKLGVVKNVRVTPLEGQTLVAGPLELLSPTTVMVASRFEK